MTKFPASCPRRHAALGTRRLLRFTTQEERPRGGHDGRRLIYVADPVVGLFTDAKLTNGLSDRFALTGPYLCLTKVSDDLLCGVTLSRHAIPFARVPNPNFGNGNIPGGQVTIAAFGPREDGQ